MSELFQSVLKESLGPDPEWDAIYWSDEDWDEDWDEDDWSDSE